MAEEEPEIIGWLDLADNDYLASRLLLLNGLLVQGAILANTAIEKYLKMVHTIKCFDFPYKRGNEAHNTKYLNSNLIKKGVTLNLNEDFLSILIKAYQMRYPQLHDNFNLALNQAKLLSCLDETVQKIRSGLLLSRTDNKPVEFDVWLREKNPFLVNGNSAFTSYNKATLFSTPSKWYEMRILKNRNWLKINYFANVDDDGKHDLEGFRIGSSGKEFHLQSPPIRQTILPSGS